MAIDSRIALNLQPLNVGQRFSQNVQNLQQVDLLNQRRDLAPLQLEQAQRANELANAQQPANLQAAERAASGLTQSLLTQDQVRQFDTSNAQSLKNALDSGNQSSILQELNSQRQIVAGLVQQRQLPESELLESDQMIRMAQTPEGLQQLKQGTDSFLSAAGGGGQLAIKSSAPIINQSTGQLETPFFNQSTGEAGVIPIEGAFQETQAETAKREFETKQKEADLDIATTRHKETIKKTVERTSNIKKEFSERRKLAARSTRKIKEAQKLSEKASQGIAGVSKVQLGRLFPGIDTSNEVALSGAFKSLALDELQKFNGPTTDFEFIVTEDIAGSLGDGAFANKARLASLERANWFMDRESKQFNDHIKAGHDPDEFFFNINELVTPKKGGKSYSLQSLQDTAVANHISIDEVIKRLSR